MEGQPKGRDAEEVLARLDQNWQELVKLIKEGRGQISTQGGLPPEAGRAIKEDRSPSGPDPGPARPETLAPGQPGMAMPPPGPAPEPPPAPLPPHRGGQKFFNIVILALLVATGGGLLFLLSQTQWGGGQVATGLLIIRGQDGGQRAWLGERDGRISLGLLDKAGRNRAEMSLDAAGNPSLYLIGALPQNRVELTMGPGGEPVLRQVKAPALPPGPGSKMPVAPAKETAAPAAAPSEAAASKAPKTEAALPENPGNTNAAPAAPTPGPGPGSVRPESREGNAPSAVPTVKLVGSKTSNKYHDPGCKWVKLIRPKNLVTFSSPEEAQQKGYVPCPGCKPPKSSSPAP